jgi:uncharacterized membrane protein
MENALAIHGNPIFAARLTPHRSLGPKGFRLLMLFVVATCFFSGMIFLTIGAWPVFGFFGLDALLIWLAFKLNYRSGRASEEVAIWRDALEVRKFAPSGKMKIHQFNPFGIRFVVERHDEIGITSMSLATRDSSLVIGSFLNPADRESFARAFAQALARAKSGIQP